MTDSDSQAVFATRVQQLGLGAFWNNFTGKRWTSHGLFAHATIQQPGTLTDEDFRRDILSHLVGDELEEHYAAVAMLHSESWAIFMRETQNRMRSAEDPSAQIRGLPRAEKDQRMRDLKALYRASGGFVMRFKGPLEPSDWLVDKLQDQHERGRLMWLDWELVGRRDKELEGVTKSEQWRPRKVDRVLVATEVEQPTTCDFQDTLDFQQLIQRRGVALHLTRWLS